jgi:hypothetical protein
MIMTNVKKIELLAKSYCDKIIKFLVDNDLESVEFINPIVVLIDMKDNENSYNVIPCVTQFIDREGMVGGVDNDNDPIDWNLSDMSVEELAYILDILNTKEFYEYVEDNDSNQIQSL